MVCRRRKVGRVGTGVAVRRFLAAALLVAAAACGGNGGSTVRGIVVDVEGDLQSGIASFVVRDNDGTRWMFEPAPGLTFDGGGPLTHITSHMVAAERVEVQYTAAADGRLIAERVADG